MADTFGRARITYAKAGHRLRQELRDALPRIGTGTSDIGVARKRASVRGSLPQGAVQSGGLVACLLAAVIVLGGCGKNSRAIVPLPPTAEGLAGTEWELEGLKLAFKTPPLVEVSGGSIPGGQTLRGAYGVYNGIIEISLMNRARAGIWDGRRLIIDGIDGVRM